MEKIYVGCAGWEYSGWIGPFYPKNLKKENHLRYYADHFNFMEINSTFYNLPKEKTVRHWLNQVPKHFLFAIKVWQKILIPRKVLNRSNGKIIYRVVKESFGSCIIRQESGKIRSGKNIRKQEV